MDTILQTMESSRIAAEALAFPPFVGPERESTPLNASPYVARLAQLREGSFLSNREAFVRQFVAAVDEFSAFGIRAVAALLGGSAIGPKPDPGDLDAVIFYESVSGEAPDVQGLRTHLKACKGRRLDLRAVPLDGDPIVVLKTISFFSMLYSKNEGSMTIVRGLILVDCRETAGAAVI